MSKPFPIAVHPTQPHRGGVVVPINTCVMPELCTTAFVANNCQLDEPFEWGFFECGPAGPPRRAWPPECPWSSCACLRDIIIPRLRASEYDISRPTIILRITPGEVAYFYATPDEIDRRV